MKKFIIEKWLPPLVVEKIKTLDGWVHLVTTIDVPDKYANTISIGYMESNPPEFYVNGELIKEDVDLQETQSRLETGL